MSMTVLADAIGPREGTARLAKQAVLVVLGIAALAIAALNPAAGKPTKVSPSQR